MFLVLSHILGLVVLLVNSIYDVFNDHDVPDVPGLIGIVGGLCLHGAYSLSSPGFEAIIWSVGVGAVFSIYGWGAYWRGMWGGADAMTLSALGFTAAGPVSGAFNMGYVLDLIANFMFASVAVTIVYSVYKFVSQGGTLDDFIDAVRQKEFILAGALALAGAIGGLMNFQGFNGLVFFLLISVSGVVFVFLKMVQDNYMILEKSPEEVEAGDVASPGQGFGRKIRGLTEEEASEVSDPVEVRTGVPFIPVFLLALLLTDLTSSGLWMLYGLY
ncbi:MAG: hypothetical protein J07AB43_12110 [Candidatus Nanosalina sp. J07AB43]|jgi:hypothetical protein|nr:MAG: hypothetical protein J07AB43_12110 [Candidatus Nanosalina sp. J07AB43]